MGLASFSNLAGQQTAVFLSAENHAPADSIRNEGHPPSSIGNNSSEPTAMVAAAKKSIDQNAAPTSTPTAVQADEQDGGGRALKNQSERWAEKRERERAELDALASKVRDIQIRLVMEALGASPNQDRIRNKWKIDGIGNITVTGQAWYNLNSEKGGRDAIGLVMHCMNCNFPAAVKWLAVEFGEKVDDSEIKASLNEMKDKVKSTFSPPYREDRYMDFVRHYLHYDRAIPMEMIDELFSKRKLYADVNKNCVFISKGIAEIRASHDREGGDKKLAEGSERRFGFIVPADPEKNQMTLAICEAAIDSVSYRIMHPGISAISAAGSGRSFPRMIADEAISGGYGVIAAFDADSAGDKASQALFNYFYLKTWLSHKYSVDKEIISELFEAKAIDLGLLTDEDDDGITDYVQQRNILFFNSANPFGDPVGFPPEITFSIGKNSFGIPETKSETIKVSPKGLAYVTQKLRITRDRPVGEKDWNEILKKLPKSEIPPVRSSAANKARA